MKSFRHAFRRFVILLLFLNLSFSVFSQINVVPFKGANPSTEKDGIIYSLPRSVIQVNFDVVKTESFKGPYADYAFKLLGLSDLITENSISYEIENVELNTFSEVDPEQFYFIEIDEKVKDSRSLLVTMSEKGYIGGFTDIKNISNNLKSALLTGDYSDENIKPFRELLKPVIIEKIDTVVRRISIDTTTIEEKVLKRSLSERTPEQQAREIAELIYKIEDSKFSLITGYQEVNYSRESLEFMIDQLNKMEKEYLALFQGIKRKSIEKHTFSVTPEASKEGTLETICRFAKNKGVMEKSGSVGESVSVIITPLNRNKAIEDFVLRREQASRKLHGFYYRIPELAEVSLRVGGMEIAEKEMIISQMGLITYLPAGNMSNVMFHPESGAIMHAVSE